MKLDFLNLGCIDYEKAYRFQKELVKKRINKEVGDTVLFAEHPSVITIGRRGSRKNILVDDEGLEKENIRVFEIDRGGDVTLHCPGQLVCYPVLDMRFYGRDIHKYMRNLEEVIIRLLADFDIEGKRIGGYTGVWVGEEKIASIGVGVKDWVTFHGFSLNVSPRLALFSLINVCGMEKARMTSVEKIKGRHMRIEEINPALAGRFKEVFCDGTAIPSVGNEKHMFGHSPVN